jgi:hypothetical protein
MTSDKSDDPTRWLADRSTLADNLLGFTADTAVALAWLALLYGTRDSAAYYTTKVHSTQSHACNVCVRMRDTAA